MLYVVSSEEGCEYSTSAESIGLKGDKDQDRGRQRMIISQEMLVEMGDQSTREVHDAPLSCAGSGSGGAPNFCNEDPPASLSICTRRSHTTAQEACTGRKGTRRGEFVCTTVVMRIVAIKPL